MKYVIGVDLGTSATKTVLFSEQGDVVASASESYPMMQPQNGWAEQDPGDWVRAAMNTLRAVAADAKSQGIDKESIVGIGLSGQMHGLTMLDEDDSVLAPCILWCDQRTGKECEELTEQLGFDKIMSITANPVLTGFTASKVLWVKKNRPEIFAKIRRILLPKDYLRLRLTGEYATDVSDASGMQLLNIAERRFSEEMLSAVGLTMDMVAPVYESCEVTGHLLKDVAEEVGLSENTIVVAGAGDNAAAAVGLGVVSEGKAFTTMGTSGVVFAHTKEMRLDPKGRVHTFCAAVPGEWHVMGVMQGCGISMQWLKRECCPDLMAEAERTGRDVYDLMTSEAADVPLGSDRLIFMPYLMGDRTPHLDPDCRGVFFGLSNLHTRGHLIRSVMEGVSYSLAESMDILRSMNAAPETMLLCGGGAKSPLWAQMVSDTYGLETAVPASVEGPAKGVAILAAVGAGLYESVPAACDAMISKEIERRYAPSAENAEKYAGYRKLYAELYDHLAGDFKVLAGL